MTKSQYTCDFAFPSLEPLLYAVNVQTERCLTPAAGLSLHNAPNQIRIFRAHHDLSQSDLAILLDVRVETISRWETTGPGKRAAIVLLALNALGQNLGKCK